MTWPELEAALAPRPQAEVVALAAKFAARTLRDVAANADHYGNEAFEWYDALVGALATATDGGATVFRRELAASTARAVANSIARAARTLGVGPKREAAELACAAVAFCLDASLPAPPRRVLSLAMQSLQAATGGTEPTGELGAASR